jgi:protein-tyrosine phosphatase
VRTAVDLRSDREVALDPPRDVPIDVVYLPVNGDQVAVVVEWPSMQEAYRGLLEEFPQQFAAAVTTVARADGPVVIHCHAGRDRTGLTCALMLRLAGVGVEAIAVDHALSDDFLAPWWQSWHDDAPDEETRERRMRVTEMRVEAMVEVLESVDARECLLAGGASNEGLDKLVVRLRGEAPHRR